MTIFQPEFSVISLDQAPLGALVIFEGAPAFVGVNPRAGTLKTLAQYEASAGRFRYRYSLIPIQVLMPAQESVVLRPKFDSFNLGVSLRPFSTQLFVDQSERFIVMSLEDGLDFRLLSLKTGLIDPATTTTKDAFLSWEIGFAFPDGFVPLLKI